jgi:hypothetical protein
MLLINNIYNIWPTYSQIDLLPVSQNRSRSSVDDQVYWTMDKVQKPSNSKHYRVITSTISVAAMFILLMGPIYEAHCLNG